MSKMDASRKQWINHVVAERVCVLWIFDMHQTR